MYDFNLPIPPSAGKPVKKSTGGANTSTEIGSRPKIDDLAPTQKFSRTCMVQRYGLHIWEPLSRVYRKREATEVTFFAGYHKGARILRQNRLSTEICIPIYRPNEWMAGLVTDRLPKKIHQTADSNSSRLIVSEARALPLNYWALMYIKFI